MVVVKDKTLNRLTIRQYSSLGVNQRQSDRKVYDEPLHDIPK